MEATNSNIRFVEPVLKRLAHKYPGMGLAIAVVFHFVFVGAYWTSEYFSRSDREIVIIPIGPTTILPPPPSTTDQQAIAATVASGELVKPDKGIPVPIPDPLVLLDKTIPTQKDYDNGTIITGADGGNGFASPLILKVPDDSKAPPDTFRPIQQLPQVVKSVIPVYPELARRIGIEGRVFVKLWVDKDGKPHQASVVQSDEDMLNQSAIDAAMATKFSPAIMNNGPVSIWITIPFVFKLKQGL